MKRLGILSVLLLVASAAAAQEAPRERPPIIDMHLHALSISDFDTTTFCAGDKWKEFPGVDPRTEVSPEQLESCPEPLVAPDTDEELLSQTLAALERFNITAVTAGDLEQVQKWRAAAPERIIPALTFAHPDEINLDSLREFVRRGDVAVLGEVWTQFAGLSPSDPALDPILALAEELDIPVAIHMGMAMPGTAYYFGSPNYRARLTNPLLLEEALLKHPKLRLYVMHAGYPYLQETIAVLNLYPQVYADIAVINWIRPRAEFHEYLRRLVEAGFGKRIMFGTDQMAWPEAIGMAVEGVESADFLTEEQKRDIFYNNAARFLRLDKKEQ
jgi:hypothetical protein